MSEGDAFDRVRRFLADFRPDFGWRPVALAATASWALILYWYHGSTRDAPRWFIDWETRLTGIEVELFHRHGWAHAMAVALLLVVPLIVARLAGMGPRDLGLGIRGAGREVILVLGLWLLIVPVIWWASTTPGFATYYPRLGAARTDAGLFLAYQAHYLVKWTAWEFFFRGFLLFGFRKDFGDASIVISTIPFTIMHVGKPEAEAFSAFLGGFVLCLIALRSKSIWPGVIIHSLVATTMDFFASSWWR